jgi:hypothetical protein
MNVTPISEFHDFIRQKVESGQFPSEEAAFLEAMRRFRLADAADEELAGADPIDHDAIAYAAREVEGKDVPSLEEVRRILSKVAGSMAQAIIEDREDRF